MQLDEIVGRWCQDGPFQAAGPGRLELTTDAGIVAIEMAEDQDGVASLETVWPVPEWLRTGQIRSLPTIDQLARATADARSGLLHCTSGDGAVTITMTVYLEGISRQAFMLAAAEVGRAYESLSAQVAELASNREALLEAERIVAEMAEAKAEMEGAVAEAESQAAEAAAGSPQEAAAIQPGGAQPPAADADESELVCPSCAVALPAGARFCITCGTPGERPPGATLPAAAGPTCGSCGAALKEGARFCSGCGATAGV